MSEASWGDSGDSGEQTRGGGARHWSSDDGGTVRSLESFVGRAVLVHEDSEVVPGFWLSVRWSAESHSRKSGGYPSVESSAELDDDCFRVGVPRIVN